MVLRRFRRYVVFDTQPLATSMNRGIPMDMKRTLIFALSLFLTSQALAQSDQEILQVLRSAADLARTKNATTQSMLSIYQMGNNAQGYRLSQYEAQYHQQFFNYLDGLSKSPGQLRNPAIAQDYQAKYWEYCYRTSQQDYRPYQQIVPAMQQWVTQRQWEASTPQGRQAYQNRRQQKQSNWNAYQANRQQQAAGFDDYMKGLRESSNQRGRNHRLYINTLNEEETVTNPYNGQQYQIDSGANQTWMNADGEYIPSDDAFYDPNADYENYQDWQEVQPD